MPLRLVSLNTDWVGALGPGRRIAFKDAGLSCILGDNESGKTTVIAALYAALGAPEDYDALPTVGSEEQARVKLVVAGTPPVPIVADLTQKVLTLGSNQFAADAPEALLQALAKKTGVEHLDGTLFPRQSTCDLTLTPSLLALLETVFSTRQAAMADQQRQRQARYRGQLEGVAERLNTEQARLTTLTELHTLLQKLESERVALAARRAEVETAEAAWSEAQQQVTSLEEQARIWKEYSALKAQYDQLRPELTDIEEETARADHLAAQLGTRFKHFEAASDNFLLDLHCLIVNRTDTERLSDQYRDAIGQVDELDRRKEELETRLVREFPEYLGIEADFLVWLRRYKELEASLHREQTELSAFQRQIKDIQGKLERLSRFDQSPADMEVQLSVLTALEDTLDASNIELDVARTEYNRILKQHTQTKTQIRFVFDRCGEDFPRQLREARAVYDQAVELGEVQEALEEQLAAQDASRPPALRLAAGWPADFPRQLALLRNDQRGWLQDLATVDRDLETGRAWRRLVAQTGHQLNALKGLQDVDEAFFLRAEEALRARQKLETENAALADLQDQISAVQQTLTDLVRFAGVDDDYPQRVDKLRTLMARRDARQTDLDEVRERRDALEAELEVAEARLTQEFADLLETVPDFPGRLREYHRLKTVEDDLLQRAAALEASIAEVEQKMHEEFPVFVALRPEQSERLEALRPHAIVLQRVIGAATAQLEDRKRYQAELQDLQAQMEAFGTVADLPDGLSSLAKVAEVVDQAWEQQRSLVRQMDQAVAAESGAKGEQKLLTYLNSFKRQAVWGTDSLKQVRDQIYGEFDSALPGLVERQIQYRAVREQAMRLSTRLEVMPSRADLEETRQGLLEVVVGQMAAAGVDTPEPARYLEYQALQSELARLRGIQAASLQRTASGGRGNDLERVQEKLAELRQALGPGVVEPPLEETLERFAEVGRIQSAMDLAREALAELPELPGLTADLDAIKAQVVSTLEDLRIGAETELDEASRQFHQYRSTQATLTGLQEACKARWHTAVAGAEPTENDLDRMATYVASLEAALGPWGQDLRDAASINRLQGEWREARQLLQQHRDLLASRQDNGAELETRRAALLATLRAGCDKLGVPQDPAADAVCLELWNDRTNREKVYQQLHRELDDMLQPAVTAGGRRTTVLDRLQSRMVSLQAGIFPFTGREDVENITLVFDADREYRLQATALEQTLATKTSPDILQAAVQELEDKATQRRQELGLSPDESPDEVAVQYVTYAALKEELRTLERTADARLPGIEELQAEMERLRPHLNGRETVTDVDAEAARYVRYRDRREEATMLSDLLKRMRQKAEDFNVALKDAVERTTEQEDSMGSWIRQQSTDQVENDYREFQQAKTEYEALLVSLKVKRPEAEVKGELEAVEAGLAPLGPVEAPPDTLQADIERVRQQEADLRQTVETLRPQLAAVEQACAALEAALPADPSSLPDEWNLQRQSVAKVTSEHAALEAALASCGDESLSDLSLQCCERTSEILSTLTRGRYLRVSVEKDGKRMVWPMQGPRVRLEQSASVRRQVDICWRLALLQELGAHYPWPVMLDEPFKDLDSGRRHLLLDLIMQAAADTQFIITTSERGLVPPEQVVHDLSSQS